MLKGRTTRLCNFKHSIILLLSFIISSCSGNFFDTDSKVVLKPTNYSQILGWENENFLNSIEAFAESCAFVRKKELRTEIKKSNGKIILDKGDKLLFDSLDNHLFDVCLLASSKQLNTKYERKTFFEDYFQPYLVINNNSAHFTGYYEPILNGSLTQYREFQYPIYGLPEDLISVDLGLSNPDSKNQKLVGRLQEGKVVPYFTRSEIEDLVAECFDKLGKDITTVVLDDIKDIGFKFATVSGTTIAIKDIVTPPQKQSLLSTIILHSPFLGTFKASWYRIIPL